MLREVKSLEKFEEVVKGNDLVVVDFTAAWCGPCQTISPIFKALSESPENSNVVFVKVDVDEAEEVSEKCKIGCMPTFQFYKDGEKVDEFFGANVETLKEKLAALLRRPTGKGGKKNPKLSIGSMYCLCVWYSCLSALNFN